MNRGTWWATVHGVAKSQTQLKPLSTHACFNHSVLPHVESVSQVGVPLGMDPGGRRYIQQICGNFAKLATVSSMKIGA